MSSWSAASLAPGPGDLPRPLGRRRGAQLRGGASGRASHNARAQEVNRLMGLVPERARGKVERWRPRSTCRGARRGSRRPACTARTSRTRSTRCGTRSTRTTRHRRLWQVLPNAWQRRGFVQVQVQHDRQSRHGRELWGRVLWQRSQEKLREEWHSRQGALCERTHRGQQRDQVRRVHIQTRAIWTVMAGTEMKAPLRPLLDTTTSSESSDSNGDGRVTLTLVEKNNTRRCIECSRGVQMTPHPQHPPTAAKAAAVTAMEAPLTSSDTTTSSESSDSNGDGRVTLTLVEKK